MKNRGYQENFSLLYEGLSTRNKQEEKANKVRYILKQIEKIQLDNEICLDLGCSNGTFTSILAPEFKSILGLDYDKVGLKTIPEDTRNKILFINGDAMTLPFNEHSFGVIICAQVYEHVPLDTRLFSELARVLKPGGVVFFSGPNKLFPIEPHYFLPFLHWLPEKFADAYLKAFKKGNHYYERSRTFWSLKTALRGFDIQDFSIPVLRFLAETKTSRLNHGVSSLIFRLPLFIMKSLIPLLPNFNWVLTKPVSDRPNQRYEIIS